MSLVDSCFENCGFQKDEKGRLKSEECVGLRENFFFFFCLLQFETLDEVYMLNGRSPWKGTGQLQEGKAIIQYGGSRVGDGISYRG